MDNISWHIEPSGKCTLECPSCDRTHFYNRFKKRETSDINIDHLYNFLKDHKTPLVQFCGNNGDPIYHKDFHRLCKTIKKLGSSLHIITNGSFKTKKWWEKLKEILDLNDTLTFSIDGLEDTNHLYRVNADWSSIMTAVNVCNNPKKFKTVWKFIPFKHNQHQIDQARTLSEKLGFDSFRLEFSDRWWDESLMPNNKFVDSNYRHQKEVIKDQTRQQGKTIKPKCLDQHGNPKKMLYIDCNGNFYPCCWTGVYAYRYKDIFNPKHKKYSIANTTLEQILNDEKVKDFFNSTKDYESASLCCKINCGQYK